MNYHATFYTVNYYCRVDPVHKDQGIDTLCVFEQ